MIDVDFLLKTRISDMNFAKEICVVFGIGKLVQRGLEKTRRSKHMEAVPTTDR